MEVPTILNVASRLMKGSLKFPPEETFARENSLVFNRKFEMILRKITRGLNKFEVN